LLLKYSSVFVIKQIFEEDDCRANALLGPFDACCDCGCATNKKWRYTTRL